MKKKSTSPKPMIPCNGLHLLCMLVILFVIPCSGNAQKKNTTGKANANGAVSDELVRVSTYQQDDRTYKNVFREAGFTQAAIDEKINKAYTDLFEGANRIYFEVGDSMAYVSDLKNHDART